MAKRCAFVLYTAILLCALPLWKFLKAESYLYTYQTLSNGDVLSGLTTLNAGARIGVAASNTDRIIFDSVGTLNGAVAFGGNRTSYPATNASTLVLANDLKLGSTIAFTSQASIEGNGCSLLLTGSMRISNEVEVRGDLTINGGGNTLELDTAGYFKLLRYDNNAGLVLTSTLRLRNMRLVQKSNRFVSCSSDSGQNQGGYGTNQYDMGALIESQTNPDSIPLCQIGTLELENVDLFLGADASFYGYLSVKGRVRIFGPGYNFILTPAYACGGVKAGGLLYVGPGATFWYRGHGRSFFDCEDSSSIFWLDNCTVKVEAGVAADPLYEVFNGWKLSRGTVIFDNRVTINNFTKETTNSFNTAASRSFELGNDGVATETQILLMAGAQVDVGGYLYHNPL